MTLRRARALWGGSSTTMCTPFIPLCYQAVIMIEEVDRVLRVDRTYSTICSYLTESNAVAVMRKPVGDGSVGTWL